MEAAEPLFRWGDGSPVKRHQVQERLERAAVGLGMDPTRFRTHSLRIGGATALYHVRPDTELIKRFGRWSSTAFHAYLWEGNETAKGIATAMALDRTTLHEV